MKKELSNYGMAAKLKLSMDKDDPDDLELTTESRIQLRSAIPD